MVNKRIRPPFVLPIASILLAIFGYVYSNSILVKIPEKEQINNVILVAVPFICYFVAVLLVYIFIINVMGQLLNRRVPERIYKIINFIIIAGIILGIIMMMQPFTIILFKMSFMVVLISLLLFMIWSHISPAFSPEEED
jgi:hypothetical protein